MIPMRLFGSRAFSAANAACFLFTAALYGALFFNAQFLQTAQGFTPLAAGLRLLPWTATLFVFAPLAGRLVSRVGERPLILVGLPMQAFGMSWLGRVASVDTGVLELAVPLVVAGAGVSLAMPVAQNAVLSAVGPTEIGKASGTYNMLYLLFNEGYGDPQKTRLCHEAIRLARALTGLMPDEPEARGMLALMLLHDARRQSRIDANGDLVRLEDQDRLLWDKAEVAEGAAILERALRLRRAGPFQLQAAIAACHATAPSVAQTDWPEIVGLYAQLAQIAPSPVVDLNHAVAIGMVEGPGAALPLVEAIVETGRLDDYYLLHAARADLLRRVGRVLEANQSYRAALDLAPTNAERQFIQRRLQSG
jgi:hypothetical protein